MENKLREIEKLLVNSLQKIYGLKGIYKIQRDCEVKIKKLEYLLTKAEFILSEFEEFEKPKEIEII